MKRIWMILSTIAIANILAMGGLVGWLKMTDRLNRDRFEAVKAIFKTTVAQDAQGIAAEQAAVETAKQTAAAEAKAAVPPSTAADIIAEKQLSEEHGLHVLLRQQQELTNLRNALMNQLADLERRERELATAKSALEAERQRIADTEGTAQFKAALATVESQKPKDAKAMLRALMDTSQSDQAVAYLARMDESKRSKVMAEFVKDDPQLAASLLEKLRTRGTSVPSDAPGKAMASNDADSAPPDPDRK